jgi:hypothetical protein
MTGGKGADIFALTSASNSTLNITDFVAGSDTIDVSRFLTSVGYTGTSTQNTVGSVSTSYLDAPATTSATTYKTQFNNPDNIASCYVQNSAYGGATSTITLLEIGA